MESDFEAKVEAEFQKLDRIGGVTDGGWEPVEMAKSRAKRGKKRAVGKTVETIRHTSDTRKNIPTAEHQSVLANAEAAPRPVRYARNTDLDPQLVWRGKDEQDWTDLVVPAPPLYCQEKIHPKALVDDLMRRSKEAREQATGAQFDLFARLQRDPGGSGSHGVLSA